MSFIPLTGTGIQTSLVGGVQPKIIEEAKLYERRYHEVKGNNGGNVHLFIVVIVSAIIFITVIAIYDVLKGFIDNYYSNLALTDPESNNDPEDITRTNIADYYTLLSSIVFAIACAGISMIALPLLLAFLIMYTT